MRRRIERLAARAAELPCRECGKPGAYAPVSRPPGAFDLTRLTAAEVAEFWADAARVCRVCRCGRVRVEAAPGCVVRGP